MKNFLAMVTTSACGLLLGWTIAAHIDESRMRNKEAAALADHMFSGDKVRDPPPKNQVISQREAEATMMDENAKKYDEYRHQKTILIKRFDDVIEQGWVYLDIQDHTECGGVSRFSHDKFWLAWANNDSHGMRYLNTKQEAFEYVSDWCEVVTK